LPTDCDDGPAPGPARRHNRLAIESRIALRTSRIHTHTPARTAIGRRPVVMRYIAFTVAVAH